MKISRLLSKTLRTDPTEAETTSHRLMLKAGMIYQVAAGIYAYLPLAWRSLRKIESIIRDEMDAAGAQELMMPTLQPIELWQKTGRDSTFGKTLFSLKDRRGRTMVLAPTHEEVITSIVRANVQSYRDLPQTLYQIQTKFRDEARPRAGLMRLREFGMKDAYSFNANETSLSESYQRMTQAYRNIYRRCQLPVVMAEADSGAIGGKDSHEFILPVQSGEDTVIICSNCSYAANIEKAAGVYPDLPIESELPLLEVNTPGIKTITDVAQFLGIPTSKTLKVVHYMADGELILVIIRGDLEINEVKLGNALGSEELHLARDDEVKFAENVAAPASHLESCAIKRVADPSITRGNNFVIGAIKPDTHISNINYPRDFQVDLLTDIMLVQPNQLCLICGHFLEAMRGVEVGHIFKLGTSFSETLDASYLDQDGRQQPITMGCYGIGTGRLLAAAIEQNHDNKGMIFPASIAPYQLHLVGLNLTKQNVAEVAEQIYQNLWDEGVETLYDDRSDQTAGVKLNDADLLGLPIRIIVSPRTLESGSVEVKERREAEATLVPLERLVSTIRDHLAFSVSQESSI
jgi:prolyl-tRNA synthetase